MGREEVQKEAAHYSDLAWSVARTPEPTWPDLTMARPSPTGLNTLGAALVLL